MKAAVRKKSDKLSPTRTPNERMYGLVPSINDRVKNARAAALIARVALEAEAKEHGDDRAVLETVAYLLNESSESLYWVLNNVDPGVLKLPAPDDTQLQKIGGVDPYAAALAAKTGG